MWTLYSTNEHSCVIRKVTVVLHGCIYTVALDVVPTCRYARMHVGYVRIHRVHMCKTELFVS